MGLRKEFRDLLDSTHGDAKYKDAPGFASRVRAAREKWLSLCSASMSIEESQISRGGIVMDRGYLAWMSDNAPAEDGNTAGE